jgi:hypothetical protein
MIKKNLLTLTLSGFIGASLQGAVILADSFATGSGDYTAGDALSTQTGTPETGAYGNPWGGQAFTSFGDPLVSASGLSYAGLASSGGAVEFNRSGSSSTSTKNIDVDLAGTPDATGDSFYFSGLLQLGGANWASLGISTGSKPVMGIGINSGGFGELRTHSVSGPTSTVVAASALSGWTDSDTVFMVGKIENNGAGSGDDLLSLYLNPSLSSEPASATVSTGVGTDGWFPSDSLSSLLLEADLVGQAPATFFDEILIGESWGDVTPVPEPSTYGLALGALALGGVMLRRRRQG